MVNLVPRGREITCRVLLASRTLRILRHDIINAIKATAEFTIQNVARTTSDGGISNKDLPIEISNLAIEDPKDGKPSRVGFKFLNDGRKVRYAKRSGEVIDG